MREGPWGQRRAEPLDGSSPAVDPAPPGPRPGSQRTPPAGRSELASQEAVHLFAKWSKGLGFLSQQQAQLQRDRECLPGGPHRPNIC